MKYYIIAGEASGDLHAAHLMRALYAQDPACDVRFWGGDAMAAAGGTQVRHYRETAVMGAVEVLKKARPILQRLSFCRRDLLAWRPDVLILVDYPGFNLKIARFAHRHGLHVAWYIVPKVWAHKAWRVKALRRDVDALYSIFPFELPWLREHGLEPRYFGNPLVEQLAAMDFRPVGEGPVVALLAGSRELELEFLLPRFVALEKLMAADPHMAGFRLVLAGAPSLTEAQYRRYLPADSRIELVFGRTRDILHQARAALVCSGTASLEAALLGTPQVVCYGFHPLTFAIARLTVHVKYISLANLVLDRPAVPELIQNDATPQRMFRELERLLRDDACRSRMAADYAELKQVLGGADASAGVAKDMYETFARI